MTQTLHKRVKIPTINIIFSSKLLQSYYKINQKRKSNQSNLTTKPCSFTKGKTLSNFKSEKKVS